ncbi:GntR family transcriptional regulator [Pseudooceanicola onchidii]|uniref:GntR family transcriptional regulator n=1 Tax=Pseudooceanicola onchidii TaxID=2562279 RepID=UPI0010AA18D3|nr:GntR family transcriptional regulator [Pseudooceanicola onchidii]
MSGEANPVRLVEAIGAKIVGGEMLPGTKLTEASLAKELGVSRAPLREALLKLEERKLIERVPYSGMRVASISSTAVDQMFEIREVLEGLACYRAAQVITPEEVASLTAWVNASEERIAGVEAEGSKALAAIGDFHDEIARISGNGELRKLLGQEIWKFLRVNYQLHSRTPERLEEATREHRQIIDALGARDAELAQLLMRRHISKARRGLIKGDS